MAIGPSTANCGPPSRFPNAVGQRCYRPSNRTLTAGGLRVARLDPAILERPVIAMILMPRFCAAQAPPRRCVGIKGMLFLDGVLINVPGRSLASGEQPLF
jgi:hypothetical protein